MSLSVVTKTNTPYIAASYPAHLQCV